MAIAVVEGQFHVGSNEDEPGPTDKIIKHSTSTRLLKTLDRIESFTIAFNCLELLKKYVEKRRDTDNFHFYQDVLDTQKKKKNAKTAVTMQTFQLLIMTTQRYRQCRSLMLPNKFSITRLEEALFASLHNDLFF